MGEFGGVWGEERGGRRGGHSSYHSSFSLYLSVTGGVDYVETRTLHSFSLANAAEKVCECITLLPDVLMEENESFDILIDVDPADSRVRTSGSTVRIIDDDGTGFVMLTILKERM